jgi:hypothetical protein
LIFFSKQIESSAREKTRKLRQTDSKLSFSRNFRVFSGQIPTIGNWKREVDHPAVAKGYGGHSEKH